MRCLLCVPLFLVAAHALRADDFPKPHAEGDVVLKDFEFASGDKLAELRIHYRTWGKPVRDRDGIVTNAVVILHGTTGSGEGFLKKEFAGELFGKGQPLDAGKFYIIIPDSLGHGESTRPSSGLRAKFPHYGYHDMVSAQHRMLTEGLKVNHLRLVMGTSMGGMHTWLWGETYPDFMDALMPLACLPAEIAGRNRAWRRTISDAIRDDPAWEEGKYKTQPPSLKTAAEIMFLMSSNPTNRQKEAPTRDEADKALFTAVSKVLQKKDANDVLYALEASRDYNPAPDLKNIKAPLLAINFADDLINPPELGILEKAIKEVPRGRAIVIPQSDKTNGHQTHTLAAVWKEHLVEFLKGRGQTKERPAPNAPDAMVKAAWEKAGAKFGWTKLPFDSLPPLYADLDNYQKASFPAFEFAKTPSSGYRALPSPDLPFALILDKEAASPDFAELAHLENLQALYLGGEKTNGVGISKLADLKRLKELSMSAFSRISDEGFKELESLTGLERLSICAKSAQAKNMKHLAKLVNLRDLEVSGDDAEFDDDSLAALAPLIKLQTIALNGLNGTPITDKGLRHLRAFPELTNLAIGFSKITDAGIKELEGLQELEVLDLSFTQITNECIPILAKLPRLRMLHLSATKVTGEGLSALAGRNLEWITLSVEAWTDVGTTKILAALGSPKRLHLRGDKIGDGHMKRVGEFHQLEELFFRGSAVTDEGFKHLVALKRLTTLVAIDTKITVAGLKSLAELNELRSLSISGSAFGDAGLREIGGMKKLKGLELVDSKFTDAGLKELAGLTELTHLHIGRNQIRDDGLKHIAALEKLESLDVSKSSVSDAGLKHLGKLSRLKRLVLNGTSVTDAGLRELEQLETLEAILLIDTKVTDEGAHALSKALPRLRIYR